MAHFEDIKKLFIDLEVYGVHPLSSFAHWLPFGPPRKCKEIRKEISRLLTPYVVSRRKAGEESDDFLSIWTLSPHVAGKRCSCTGTKRSFRRREKSFWR